MESIEAVLDLDRLRADIAVLEEQAAAPSLWDNPDEAQKITSRLSHLQAEVRKAEALRGRIDDLAVLFEMAEEEDDPDTRAEAESELTAVKKALDEMEVRTLLSGEYDALTVMKLKEVIDRLEEAADAFEHVANTVETISVKES